MAKAYPQKMVTITPLTLVEVVQALHGLVSEDYGQEKLSIVEAEAIIRQAVATQENGREIISGTLGVVKGVPFHMDFSGSMIDIAGYEICNQEHLRGISVEEYLFNRRRERDPLLPSMAAYVLAGEVLKQSEIK